MHAGALYDWHAERETTPDSGNIRWLFSRIGFAEIELNHEHGNMPRKLLLTFSPVAKLRSAGKTSHECVCGCSVCCTHKLSEKVE